MMRILPVALVSLALLTTACPTDGDGPGDSPGGEEGEGEGDGGDDMQLLGPPKTVDINMLIANGLTLAVRGDGRAAFAYVQLGSETIECVLTGGGTVTADTVAVVVVDEQTDGTFRTRIVDDVPPIADVGLDLAVDPASDALVLAFMGGEPAAGVCGASDLIVAVESGDTFVLTTVAQNGNDGSGPCRSGIDPLCTEGDFVGKFPGLAISDSAFALAYTDNHFGFGETDIFKSDLEVARGTSPPAVGAITSVNTESGAGYHATAALTPDGRVVIAHNIIGNNVQDEGAYSEVEQADGTFLEVNLLENPGISSRMATTVAADGRIFIAFREDGTQQLLVFQSVDDGASFTFEAPERLGVTGFNPQLGVMSDGTLVVAYGHCRDVADGDDLCDTSADGVRLAWRSASATVFSKKTFTGDDEDQDGIAVDMVIGADDLITTLSLNASQGQATISQFQKVAQ